MIDFFAQHYWFLYSLDSTFRVIAYTFFGLMLWRIYRNLPRA